MMILKNYYTLQIEASFVIVHDNYQAECQVVHS
jgi:uncharacterized protein YkvS